jgi:hypothetical protein
MSEQEIKNLLTVYQQKVSELTAQTIALEARIMNSNQILETMNKKVIELTAENQKLSATKSKKIIKENTEEDFV